MSQESRTETSPWQVSSLTRQSAGALKAFEDMKKYILTL